MRKNMNNGKYYRKIRTSLLTSSFVFALFSIIIFSILFYKTHKDISIRQKSIFSSYLNTMNISSFYLYRTESIIDKELLYNWNDSPVGSNYRYYYTSKIYKILSSASNNLEQIVFDTVVFGTKEDRMVITASGTTTIDYYCNVLSNLGVDGSAWLNEIYSATYPQSSIYPVYSEDGLLTDLYVCSPIILEDYSHVYILTRLFFSQFFDFFEGVHSFIVFPNQQIISFNKENDNNIQDVIKAIDSNSSFSRTGQLDENIYYGILADMMTKYICIFDSSNDLYLLLVFGGLCFVIFSLFVYFILDRKAKKLYSPISEVVSSDNESLIMDKEVDEIAILKRRNEKLSDLSSQLRKANDEMLYYAKQNLYRSILDGNYNNQDIIDDKKYRVVLIKVINAAEEITKMTSFLLYLQTRDDDDFHYISTGVDRVVLFFLADTKEDTLNILNKILVNIPESLQYICTVSDTISGILKIRYGYIQCRKNLTCINESENKKIFFSEDISKLNQASLYDFSIDDENVLINHVLSGRKQAKEELDLIIHENIDSREITYESKIIFCHNLISTLSRIISKMKIDASAVFGDSYDIRELYIELDYKILIKKIQKYFYLLIDYNNSSLFDTDAKMINEMKLFIHKHYMENIGLQDLADQFNISTKYCGSLFTKLSNDTFTNYLNRYRIDIAKDLFRENPMIKIQDVARMVGFNSSQNFIRVFGKYTGLSPKAYADEIHKN